MFKTQLQCRALCVTDGFPEEKMLCLLCDLGEIEDEGHGSLFNDLSATFIINIHVVLQESTAMQADL